MILRISAATAIAMLSLLMHRHATGAIGSANCELHPISITQADVFVNRTKVSMRLKSFADDLELIQGVEAFEDGRYDSEELRQAVKDHGEFLLERIDVFDASGKRLEGKIVETVELEIPPDGLMSGDLMEHYLGYTIEYQYDKPPEYLTFQHEIIDENFLFPSEMKMLIKQAGSDSPYAAMLKTKKPETVRFDWDKPLSREASGDELRDWFDAQREKTLGITSYSSVYSFIYITPKEVRQELLVPLANLAAMVDFQQADPYYLEVDEQDDARHLIEGLFSTGNPVVIDGQVVKPRFDRVDFYGLDVRDFAIQAEKRRVNLANGRVGIIMSYPATGIPNSVEITWDQFSKTLRDVDAVVFALDKVEKTKFSRYLTENTFSWKNPGIPPLPKVVSLDVGSEAGQVVKTPVPVVSLVLASMAVLLLAVGMFGGGSFGRPAMIALLLFIGAGICFPIGRLPIALPGAPCSPLPDDQSAEVFATLHKNLFRAFDYYDEDSVYDALSATTDGRLLRDFYLQMRKSLEIKEQGGAVSNINDIQILDAALSPDSAHGANLPSPGFAFRCKWNLVGTIEHWGHIHQRTNTYDAVFNVENVEGTWKFTSYEPIDETQGVVRISLRKF